MKKGTILLMSIMLLIGLVLSGCSNDKKTGGSKSEGKNPASGNDLVIGAVQDPQNWDPIDTFLVSWATVSQSVFEGLVNRTTDLKLEPGLATSWKYLDDKTLQFKLRKGVKFQNGEPFNANAVKFTFDRLLGDEGAKGPQQSNYNTINHVKIVDDYTVNFILNQKDPVLLTKLSGYGSMIVPPKYIKEKGGKYFDTHPIGTGPFKMVSYKRDSKIVLEKNEDYWKKGLPKLDKVTFRIIPEPSTRLAELQTGAIDIDTSIEVSQAKTVKDEDFLNLEKVGSPTVYALRFDTSKPPFDKVKARKAVNYAIDKQALIKDVLKGYGKQISSFQSKLSFGYNSDLKPYPYDPKKAKQLLKEAGVKEGTAIDVYIPGNSTQFKEITEAIAYYLEQVGLKLNINTAEINTLTNDLIPKGKAGQMYRNGWGGWTLDFDNTAYLMYHKGEFWNPNFYDPKVEKLLKEERSTVDQEKRKEVFKKLTEYLHELSLEVNLYQAETLWGVNKRVQDFVPPHDDRIDLKNVTIKSK